MNSFFVHIILSITTDIECDWRRRHYSLCGGQIEVWRNQRVNQNSQNPKKSGLSTSLNHPCRSIYYKRLFCSDYNSERNRLIWTPNFRNMLLLHNATLRPVIIWKKFWQGWIGHECPYHGHKGHLICSVGLLVGPFNILRILLSQKIWFPSHKYYYYNFARGWKYWNWNSEKFENTV